MIALLQETSHNAAVSVVIIIVSHACEKINKIVLAVKALIFNTHGYWIKQKKRLPEKGKRFLIAL